MTDQRYPADLIISTLKARVADLVWLKQRPRNIQFALAAIDAYRLIPLDTETWLRGGHECWERAISLARMLKAGAGTRLAEIEIAILDGSWWLGLRVVFNTFWNAARKAGGGAEVDAVNAVAPEPAQ